MIPESKGKVDQVNAPVVENKAVAPGVYKLRLEAPAVAKSAKPGQFLMLRVGKTLDPLLRRPFSIHAVHDARTIDVLYRVIGKGTNLLAAIRGGEDLDIVGPLGRGFSWSERTHSLVVAGGMGIAPLFFLAQFIIQKGAQSRTTVLIGARDETQVLCVEALRGMGFRVQIATEDGSRGKKGLVTGLITRKIIDSMPVLYGCGPYPMLRALAGVAGQEDLSGQVSLESVMACGVGACQGCVAERPDGSLARVCQEGPVFEVKEVTWG